MVDWSKFCKYGANCHSQNLLADSTEWIYMRTVYNNHCFLWHLSTGTVFFWRMIFVFGSWTNKFGEQLNPYTLLQICNTIVFCWILNNKMKWYNVEHIVKRDSSTLMLLFQWNVTTTIDSCGSICNDRLMVGLCLWYWKLTEWTLLFRWIFPLLTSAIRLLWINSSKKHRINEWMIETANLISFFCFSFHIMFDCSIVQLYITVLFLFIWSAVINTKNFMTISQSFVFSLQNWCNPHVADIKWFDFVESNFASPTFFATFETIKMWTKTSKSFHTYC